MSKDKMQRTAAKFTARELLVEVAGQEHADHTVVERKMSRPKQPLVFKCSCGARCSTVFTEDREAALQNVAKIMKDER
jgi:protein tyrosine phosphatase (PTP) superfamily phosphohydrolase (DUF442 family)